MKLPRWCNQLIFQFNFAFRHNYIVTFPQGTLVNDVVHADGGTEFEVSELALRWLHITMPRRWCNLTDRTVRHQHIRYLNSYINRTVLSDVLVFYRLEDAVLAEQQWCGTLLNTTE